MAYVDRISKIQPPKGSGMEGKGAVWVSRVEQDVNTTPIHKESYM